MQIVMRFFRKHQTQSANADSGYKKDQHRLTESMPLINEDNRAFLKGKRQKLAQSSEVFDNLEASIGITRPGCAIQVGCGAVFTVSLGILFTFLGLLASVATIGSLLQSPHLTPETSTTAVMLASGMIFLLFMGPGGIMQSYLAERNWGYITGLYNQLLAHGQIVEGTIISVEQAMIEQVVTPRVILHYRFTVPGQPREYEGQYKLFPDQTFETGQKVTVLYLSRFIQVLL
jgi:hypothetical protein